MGFVKISHMDELTIAGKIFRFLSADGDDSDLDSTQSQKIGVYNPDAASKIPQFIKDAILEKHTNLLEKARQEYIEANNEFLKKRDKKLNRPIPSDFSQNCTSILRKYPDLAL